MTQLLTSAEMRAIEQATIARGAVTGADLMERAGAGVVDAILAEWPELATGARRAEVLCGPGNNGGDGFVVARLLQQRGWTVAVHIFGDASTLPDDARLNYTRWRADNPVHVLTSNVLQDPWHADIVVDALFGIGLSRPFAALGDVRKVLNQWQNLARTGQGPKIISIDVPSGMDADSGTYPGRTPKACRIVAHLTVTFHAPKIGHFIADGPAGCRKLVVVDIGLKSDDDPFCIDNTPGGTEVSNVTLVQSPKYQDVAKDGAHKFAHGHALVLTGGMGRTGAARLAARGALRVGSGLVTVGAAGSAMMECAIQLTSIMLRKCDGVAALHALLADSRINALCVGPALGVDQRAVDLVATGLNAARSLAVVLDADALTVVAQDPALFDALHDRCVMTPHGGEFARLFPDIARKLEDAAPDSAGPYSKVAATRDAAKQAGCVVVFKGADTVIAAPDGQCSVHGAVYDRAAPWLATAGSGDVLAGFVTGFMARGFSPKSAADTAVWMHTECARLFGAGLIAEDLPDMVAQVMSQLQCSSGEQGYSVSPIKSSKPSA